MREQVAPKMPCTAPETALSAGKTLPESPPLVLKKFNKIIFELLSNNPSKPRKGLAWF